MKRRLLAGLAALCILAVIWLSATGVLSFDAFKSRERQNVSKRLDSSEGAETDQKFRSRERVATRTHRPEQLPRFILPQMEIDGLALRPSLDKLMAAYVDACKRSGETPLAFTFDVPAGDDSRLKMKLSAKSFSSSIRLLAAAAGMEVSRNDLNYVFSRIQDRETAGKLKISVSPGIFSRFRDLTGNKDQVSVEESPIVASGENLRRMLAEMGISLDPATTIELDSSKGELRIDSAGAADIAKLEALTRIIGDEPEVQSKYTTKVVELPAGFDASKISLETYSDAQIQSLLRTMAGTAGVNLMTMPSIMAKDGNSGKIELIKEVIYPVGDDFETRNVGKVLNFKGGALGFGQEMAVDFQDTAMDEHSGGTISAGSFHNVADLQAEGYSDDGTTRVAVQQRKDGSRVLLLVTVDRIDPTGRLLRTGN